ncbi:ATP-dependent helicase [Mechercharimyces sp. CAU 1602]|uniref:ATP-dependent helicase n=1 Tax=Mechercharimyces sp. CAU 1602 TaxID=2973933 RepID=UPI002161EC51|nr:ATP-dependent helicase [Mechercharimyces sp. CAU 1602]MCS1350948.1 ATP-dependent helicase [Mechercharimyces sp. CAU 1602]
METAAATSAHFKSLNESQHRAVSSPIGPVAVFAGPGSGKTTVLTRRVEYLIAQGITPEKMMVVTFTKAAATEMKERLRPLIGQQVHHLMIGTFHSIYLKIFRQLGVPVPTIVGEDRQRKWVRESLIEADLPAEDDEVMTLVQRIGLCKSQRIYPASLQVKKEENVRLKQLYQAYEARKKEEHAWDFDDILIAFLSMQESGRYSMPSFEAILVDEFQDVNRVQFEALCCLASEHQHLFVVGDDDQSIYGFRGSDPKWMLELERSFPGCEKIILTKNYRSTDSIIELSQKLIQHNKLRQVKKISGTKRTGSAPCWITPSDEEEEADQLLTRIQDGVETAILYRSGTQARALIDALVQQEVPFQVSSGDAWFYHQWQVRDLLAYLQLAQDGSNRDALLRIINKPKRYLNGDEWLHMAERNALRQGCSLLEALPTLEGLKVYQRKAMQTLLQQMNRLRLTRTAAEAITFIREEIGYDRFIRDFAKHASQDTLGLLEPVEELSLAAKRFPSGRALLVHVEKVKLAVRRPRGEPAVHLMTFHKAKGLEFERVFLIGLHAMTIPHRKSLEVPEGRKRGAWEEERRLLYVGMTRAKSELVFSISRSRQGKRVAPSPFMKELGWIDPDCFQPQDDPLLDRERAKRRFTTKKRREEKPQQQFAHEEISVGSSLHHSQWGKGHVVEIEYLEGLTAGRKMVVHFTAGKKSIHYELSRQLGLIVI